MNLEKYKTDLIKHEGWRKKPYECTAGKLTIGVGINLEEGLYDDEIQAIHDLRTQRLLNELFGAMPWIEDLPDPAQRALADMHFNLGFPRLMKFKKMLTALQEGRFIDAGVEALDSRWAKQVGNRALDVVNLYEECEV